MELVDGSRYPHEGEVDFADNRIDPATGTLQIRAEFPNEEGHLTAGMFVRILAPKETEVRMLVPEISLQRDMVGPYLLVADSANLVQRRDVELGQLVGTERIITGGLEGNDRVIVRGLQRAIPGNPVTVQEAAPPASPSPAPVEEANEEAPAESDENGE